MMDRTRIEVEWRNRKDQLPEPGAEVLIVHPHGVTLAEYWTGEYGSGWSDLTSDGVSGWYEDEIEWWMPMPASPAPVMN